MARIAIVDYGAGNLHSVRAGFQRIMQGDDTIEITDDPARITEASHIVLPGVGAFATCINALRSHSDICTTLNHLVLEEQRPFMGICVGMQMMMETGHEHGTHRGLGWFQGDVVPLKYTDESIRIPHMGWNALDDLADHPITEGIKPGDHAYFVHSYHAECNDAEAVLARSRHGQPISAMIGKDHMVGTQFHPEKRQSTGLQMIANFLTWTP